MPLYRATVGTPTGERMVVEREAPSIEDLTQELTARGLFALEVVPQGGHGLRAALSGWSQKVNRDDLIDFSHSLRQLIKAGMPIYQALELLLQGETRPGLRRVVADLIQDLGHGLALSEAMAKAPSAIPGWYVSSVQAAERTGGLVAVLADLEAVLVRQKRIRDRLLEAALYPTVLLLMLGTLIGLALGWVLPTLKDAFSSMGVELPADTLFLLAVSDWVSSHLLLVALSLAALVYEGWRAAGNPAVRERLDRYRYRLPLVGPLARAADLAHLTRSLAALVGAGVPLNEAVSAAGATVENTLLRREVDDTLQRIERGEPVSGAARRAGLLDDRATAVVRVGEESASLPESLENLAALFEDRLDTSSGRLLFALQNSLIIVVAILVAVTLATFLRPMLQAMSKI